MEKLRAENRTRRMKLEAAREAAKSEAARIDTLKAEIKRLNQKTKILSSRMAETRSFLCRDAAGLVGLRLKRRKSGKVEYLIGGVLIPNLLTDLGGMQTVLFARNKKEKERAMVLMIMGAIFE